MCSLSWIEVRGIKYKKSIVVLDNDELPKFGVVENIIVFNTDIYYFICSLLVTEYTIFMHFKPVNGIQRSILFVSKLLSMITPNHSGCGSYELGSGALMF